MAERTRAREAAADYPDLEELIRRRDETAELVDAAVTSTRANAAARWANLSARLESYEHDIAEMRKHELVRIEAGAIAAKMGQSSIVMGFVWGCSCGAHGGRPTRLQAAKAHGLHVMREVWGA